MPLSVRVNGLDTHGVHLISPSRPDFDQLARPLIGHRIADVGLALKPMLVIVSNESPQTIVSLSIVWHITDRDDRTHRFWGHASFPGAVCGDGALSGEPPGLEAGRQRVEAYGLVIHGWGNHDAYFDQFLGQFVDGKNAALADAVDLRIELNAVIFADGTLVGPDDDSALSDLFSAYVQAKQEWYRGIVGALDAGRPVADAFGPVERFLADAAERRQTGASLVTESHAALWTHQAAAEARSWRRRYRDEEVPRLLNEAIRLEPFLIKRT
jgi:hypothetical protein